MAYKLENQCKMILGAVLRLAVVELWEIRDHQWRKYHDLDFEHSRVRKSHYQRHLNVLKYALSCLCVVVVANCALFLKSRMNRSKAPLVFKVCQECSLNFFLAQMLPFCEPGG